MGLPVNRNNAHPGNWNYWLEDEVPAEANGDAPFQPALRRAQGGEPRDELGALSFSKRRFRTTQRPAHAEAMERTKTAEPWKDAHPLLRSRCPHCAVDPATAGQSLGCHPLLRHPCPLRDKPTSHENKLDWLDLPGFGPPHAIPSTLPATRAASAMSLHHARTGWIWLDLPCIRPLHSAPSLNDRTFRR